MDGGGALALLDGGDGNDYLHTGAGAGNATMLGGAGDDFIDYHGHGVATIDGGADSDKIYGGALADNITGGTGDDQIDGRASPSAALSSCRRR